MTKFTTKFEKAVFAWIRTNYDDPSLRAQLQMARICSRDHTGVGCYCELVLSGGVPPTNAYYGKRGPLDGPGFKSPVLEHGGGTLLWFENGYATTLEIFTFGDDFPKNHDDLGDFELLCEIGGNS
jgi:hypothetical protein